MTRDRIPLCVVITPTWQRHDLLMNRCIPSVQVQSYPRVKHIIVSDGPDDGLVSRLAEFRRARHRVSIIFRELEKHDPEPHWGSHARLRALQCTGAEYITYCDDDDALRPEHCALMVKALDENPEAGFAVSRMRSHHPSDPSRDVVVEWGPLVMGNVGTPMIMHRREVLEHGTWGEPSFTEDWELVWSWMQAGVAYANVDAEIADVYPSFFRPDTTHGNKPGTLEKA